MSKAETLKKNILQFMLEKGAEYGDDLEELEELLNCFDFRNVYQAVCGDSRPVYCFKASDRDSKVEYCGKKLFEGNACKLYSREDFSGLRCCVGELYHAIELWVLDDMSLAVVSCATISGGPDDFSIEYREHKGSRWSDEDAYVEFDVLRGNLRRLCLLKTATRDFYWRET